MAQPKLSRELIVDAAIGLVDREGPAALSMRLLAADLGVGTMTLYHYVADRAELIDAMAARILRVLEPPRPGEDWRAVTRIHARAFRNQALAHPGAFALIRSQPSAVGAQVSSSSFEFLRAAGLSRHQAGVVFRILERFIVGWSLYESTLCQASGREHGRGADRDFAVALDALLDGLTARVASGV